MLALCGEFAVVLALSVDLVLAHQSGYIVRLGVAKQHECVDCHRSCGYCDGFP
jgi:hypothetical protein